MTGRWSGLFIYDFREPSSVLTPDPNPPPQNRRGWVSSSTAFVSGMRCDACRPPIGRAPQWLRGDTGACS